MARARYSADQRRVALDLFDAGGSAYASAETGIPEGTIRSWASREPGATASRDERRAAQADRAVEAWRLRRARLADKAGQTAEVARDIADEALAERRYRDAHQVAQTFAIFVDRAEKIGGGLVPADSRTPEEIYRDADALLERLVEQSRGPDGEPYRPPA